MAINLVTKYADKLVDAYYHESFLGGRAKGEFSFVGARTIKLMNIVTQTVGDYNRAATSNRFGTMAELQDEIQELTLAKEPCFNISIDKANNTDQLMLKAAGKVMAAEIREQIVPYKDKWLLKKWYQNAGKSIALGNATITGEVMLQALTDAEIAMDNAGVPEADRYAAIPYTDLGKIRMDSRWQYTETGTDEVLVTGQFNKFGTLKVFGMPDSYFDTDIHGLVFQSKAVIAPDKINTARIITDCPDLDGALLQGHYYFDGFVVGKRCDGVIAIVAHGAQLATPTVTKGDSTTITCANATAIYYTVDGTDPRYSATRVKYTAALTNPAAGVVIKAVGMETDGKGNSAVKVHTCV